MEVKNTPSLAQCELAVRSLLDGGDRLSLEKILKNLSDFTTSQVTEVLGKLTATGMYDTAGGLYGRRNL